MQFSEAWLRTFVDPPLSTQALCDLLTMSALEVEECVPVAPPFTSVVVGRVLTVEKHPKADRLNLCSVDVGASAPLQIVCGAPNVAVGMRAPVALVGASLPGGMAIKAAKVRDVESHGMLCSAKELGLSEDHGGLLALPADAPIGKDFRAYQRLDDALITIKLTPNLGHCLSLLGVARELAALTGAKLTPPVTRAVSATGTAHHAVKITDADGCGRFTGRVIRNVNAAAPTPEWMKERLLRSGQRPISALVDVTNYVMLELGRPLHVYDADKLQGAIDVRWGRAGEQLELLNGQVVAVDREVLCITDDRGPIGLAGIMGGATTKAETTSRNVFLESAFFYPTAIAGRSRRFNFSSDASHRFERGVDFDNNVAGIERATQLILEICGGEAGPTEDHVARLPVRKPVTMRVDRARKVIGVPIPDARMMEIFALLGLAPKQSGATITVAPPSYRFDLEIEEDLIEEIARVYGFDNIPAVPPRAAAAMSEVTETRRTAHDLRERLAATGYQEVINFSFVESAWERDFAGETAPIALLNPIASQMSVMRTTLIGGLIATIRYNLNRGMSRVRVFEVGRVFLPAPHVAAGPLTVAGIDQPNRIAGVAFGPADDEQWGLPSRGVDFFDLKGDLAALAAPWTLDYEVAIHPALHPGRSARVSLAGQPLGWIGELHPKWVQQCELPRAPVVFELDVAPLLALAMPRYDEISKFPAVERDLSMIFPESASAAAIEQAVERAKPALVRAVKLFDLYRGKGVPEGEKSLAFRVVMQDTARTLTDADVASAMAKIRAILEAEFGARLR
jgi:phenylalanyl-tRNA synthetase beta chain